MGANFVQAIVDIGTNDGNSPSERRSIIFANCISLILSTASIMLFVLIPGNHNLDGVVYTLKAVMIFSLPLLLNHFSLYNLSKIFLCWVPAISISWSMITGMQSVVTVSISTYDGLRLYVLAASCIPYILLNRKELTLFILGILPSLLLLLFFSQLTNLAGVDYLKKGVLEWEFNLTQVRYLIAYVVVNGSCFSLKFIIDNSDRLNQRLIVELERKNQIIQAQAKHQLQGAYERLKYHVNNTPLAIIERDKNLNITFWNKRAEELFEWQQHEVLGKKTHQFLVPAEDVGLAQKAIQEMVDGDFNSNSIEVRNVCKSGKFLFCKWYYSLLRDEEGNVQALLAFVSDMTEQKTANYQLNERIKELTTLYRSGQILQNKDRLVNEVLQELVNILPPGWQYPEITAARVVIGGVEFKTSNFSEPVSKQKAEFDLPQGSKGIIEVVYLKETPEESEGAFLAEERNLINMIAELLSTYFVRRYESEALRKSEANLNATINNTNVIIWSVDRKMNLLAYNLPFKKHLKERFGFEPVVGSRILREANSAPLEKLAAKWERLYAQALEGEIVTFEENQWGIDFHCSLCPIIEEDGRVTGVSVFAEDITDDKLRAKELGEALKKIGELRLMALRSVMNPHFVFNVLNSIQFYIVGNDRLNAVNYLSTFSKLIRSILTHSVQNKIRIEDEIELLKNYVQLERVRFENKFSFTLEVDPQVEMDIEIPSLLIQPYVENAILHGLYNKQGTGCLTIRIKEGTDAIVFEIEDDGVGREAAMQIKQRSFGEHKSMGTKLTEERLKLINAHHNVSYEIVDLMNGTQPCGTKVIVWVKLND